MVVSAVCGIEMKIFFHRLALVSALLLGLPLQEMVNETPREPLEPRTADEVVAVLTRPPTRGLSRYDGPRLPLRFGFRPGDATLGRAAEVQLREVGRALRTARLASVESDRRVYGRRGGGPRSGADSPGSGVPRRSSS
jgi:hypothetical protein